MSIITIDEIWSRQGDEIKSNLQYRFIGDEYQDLINRIHKFGLKATYLHFTNFDSQKFGMTNIFYRLLKELDDIYEDLIAFDLSIKNVADIKD